MGLFLVATAVVVWHRRLRAKVAWVLLLGAVAFGLFKEVLLVSDLWSLPALAGLTDEVALLMAWSFFAVVARSSGGVVLRGHPLWIAPLTGAILGEWAAAGILAAGARSKGGAARMALAASAGGLIGRLGDPAMMMLGHRDATLAWRLIPLAVLLVLVAGPKREDLEAGGRWDVTLVALGTSVATIFFGVWAVLAGSVALILCDRAILGALSWRFPLWTLASIGLVMCSVAAGGAELAALGLEQVQDLLGTWAGPALTFGSGLISMLLGGSAGGLVGAAVLDRALMLNVPDALVCVAAGAAVGGIGPLVVSGSVRAGWWRLILQLAVAVVFVWLVV